MQNAKGVINLVLNGPRKFDTAHIRAVIIVDALYRNNYIRHHENSVDCVSAVLSGPRREAPSKLLSGEVVKALRREGYLVNDDQPDNE